MKYLYRALNEHELNYLNGKIVCNLCKPINANNKICKEICYEIDEHDFSLAVDRIIGHVGGQNINHSLWISTSKDFRHVISKYAIPQAGKYNSDDYRKEIIVIDPNKKNNEINLENVRNSKNVIDLFGKYIDISNDNLNKYYQNDLILPYYKNSNVSLYGQSLYKNIFNEGKKTEITGFNNFAKASKEVLFFVFIDSKNIKYRLDPLMQDIIYAFLVNKLSEKNIGNLSENDIGDLIDEKYNTFYNIDYESKLNTEELNIFNYLYKPYKGKYNSLITLIKYIFPYSKNIKDNYEALKEIKRIILRKITGLEKIKIVDDEIDVFNDLDEINNFPKKSKNNIIYCVDNNTLLEKEEITKRKK